MLVFNNKNIYPNLCDFIAFYPADILHLLNNEEMFELNILYLELNEKKEEEKKVTKKYKSIFDDDEMI